MIIVDFSNILYAAIYAHSKGNPVADGNLIRHICLNSLRHIKASHGEEFGKMVICLDSGNTWRRDYFPEYKAKRRIAREESPDAETDAMYSIIHQIQDELKAFGPYPCMQVAKCEADDIIAVLSFMGEFNETYNDKKVLIVSNDKDFFQLHAMRTVFQYIPRDKKVFKHDDPGEYLINHIAQGDSGDGIPNVLSDGDCFITEGKRQTPLTKSKRARVLLNPDSLGTGVKKNWDRNQKLIDLTKIPEQLATDIVQEFIKISDLVYGRTTSRGMDFYTYLLQNDMKLLAEDIEDFMRGE